MIEHDKGAHGRRACSSADAFPVLVELSQSRNKKLRVVAQTVVDAAAEGQLGPK